MEPTVVNGGVIVNWANESSIGNVKNGTGPLWVIEADESDKSLLNYTPAWAIITTISMDHFGLEETIELFRDFAAHVQQGIICGPGVKQHLLGATQATLLEIDDPPAPMALHMPGNHNQLNAACTALLCEQLGGSPPAIRIGLERFAGIERRMQHINAGTKNQPAVYDDFGHNPEKIQAAMQAVSGQSDRILACWKPHGFGPLKTMAEELIAMWSAFKATPFKLYILPVYYVGGTTSRAMESDQFVEMLQAADIDACYAPDYPTLEQILLQTASPGDSILSMGARDPDLPLFARNLAAKLART
jgi:UDP-N-acetylmuramate--alanine ligase